MRSKAPWAALLVFVLLVFASPANAQAPKPSPDAKVGVPFDAASLESALKGLRAFNARMAGAEPLAAQLTDAQQKMSAVHAKNQNKVDDYISTRDAIGKCVRAYSASRNADRTTQVQRKVIAIASDQDALEKFSQEYARLAQLENAATARNDSAEVQKLGRDISALLTLDAKADSVANAKKCGVTPAKPEAFVELDALQATADSLTRQLKPVESAADSAGARAAGVAPARFTQMRGRLVQFIANDAAFTDTEGDMLKARRAEIEGLVKRQ